MANLVELLASTEMNNTLWTCTFWDPNNSTTLMNYKGGGIAAPRTLNFIGKDYITAVEKDKPLLHIWPLNSQQTVQGTRFVLPGKATAASLSSDGRYIVIGVGEKIYIWQISSGSLITIISRHYQPITVLKFCEDSHHFVSAGEDGILMVWSLAQVCCHPQIELFTQRTAGQHDPLYMFSDHSLPITDVFISKFGLKGRLATVSSDRSCRIYDLSNGELLLNVVFNSALLSLTMDPLELYVFTGNMKGEINKMSLTFVPRNKDQYLNNEDLSDTYSGHSKGVTCLSVSQSGELLASGSNDETVIIWHVVSKQQVRTLKHKGPITNLMFFISPDAIFRQEFSPNIILHPLQRSLEKDSDNVVENEVFTKTKNNFWDKIKNGRTPMLTTNISNGESNDFALQQEIQRLRQVNAELYSFSVQKILKNSADNIEKPNKKRKRNAQ